MTIPATSSSHATPPSLLTSSSTSVCLVSSFSFEPFVSFVKSLIDGEDIMPDEESMSQFRDSKWVPGTRYTSFSLSLCVILISLFSLSLFSLSLSLSLSLSVSLSLSLSLSLLPLSPPSLSSLSFVSPPSFSFLSPARFSTYLTPSCLIFFVSVYKYVYTCMRVSVTCNYGVTIPVLIPTQSLPQTPCLFQIHLHLLTLLYFSHTQCYV